MKASTPPAQCGVDAYKPDRSHAPALSAAIKFGQLALAVSISFAATSSIPCLAADYVPGADAAEDLFQAGFYHAAEMIACGRKEEAGRYAKRVLMALFRHDPDLDPDKVADMFIERVTIVVELKGDLALINPKVKKSCDFLVKNAWGLLPYEIRQLNKPQRRK